MWISQLENRDAAAWPSPVLPRMYLRRKLELEATRETPPLGTAVTGGGHSKWHVNHCASVFQILPFFNGVVLSYNNNCISSSECAGGLPFHETCLSSFQLVSLYLR